MRFKHIHKNPIYTRQCWSFHFDYLIHFYDGFRLMNPSLIIIRLCGYTFYNSVSHHDGCCLVHPDTWYHLFGLPSCRMLFGASRQVVSIIRSPIMPDAVWSIPIRGINYSVSHHDGCRLVHPDTRYQLNATHHQDGCRLVHPAKWDISSMSYAIMTDADWCIPSSGILENFGVPS